MRSVKYDFWAHALNKLVYVLPDEWYLFLRFKNRVGYWPHLRHPRSFNEKLQWLKLHDKHAEYTQMVDKVEAKKYVASILGEEYIIPTLGVWNSVDEIEWDKLPNQFVIKVTSDSGGVIVCKDKSKLDMEKAKEKLSDGWGKNYYVFNKEYPYRDLKPRIIAEEYKEDESGYELKDYKFFCFNGTVQLFKIDYDRTTAHHANYYSRDGEKLPFGEAAFKPTNKNITLPSNLGKMIELAENLAKDKIFVRVDFYDVNNKIYFGEITFFPASGMGKFTDEKWDFKLGEMIELPKNK